MQEAIGATQNAPTGLHPALSLLQSARGRPTVLSWPPQRGRGLRASPSTKAPVVVRTASKAPIDLSLHSTNLVSFVTSELRAVIASHTRHLSRSHARPFRAPLERERERPLQRLSWARTWTPLTRQPMGVLPSQSSSVSLGVLGVGTLSKSSIVYCTETHPAGLCQSIGWVLICTSEPHSPSGSSGPTSALSGGVLSSDCTMYLKPLGGLSTIFEAPLMCDS